MSLQRSGSVSGTRSSLDILLSIQAYIKASALLVVKQKLLIDCVQRAVFCGLLPKTSFTFCSTVAQHPHGQFEAQ